MPQAGTDAKRAKKVSACRRCSFYGRPGVPPQASTADDDDDADLSHRRCDTCIALRNTRRFQGYGKNNSCESELDSDN